MRAGTLVISLDFELFWGMRDRRTIAAYGHRILGVREALPRMLEAFDAHGVHATFAAVGLLFFGEKESLLRGLPALRPTYANANLSPYNGHIDGLGKDEADDPYHFGASLIRMIQAHPAHEIAGHTFSHYYCLEHGQTEEQFDADMAAAVSAAHGMGVELRSFIFPRNQYNERYLAICARHGIIAYRGNERSWLYDARNREDESRFRRGLRLLDTWLPISGANTHAPRATSNGSPLDIPSSRFLRPYSARLAALDGLKIRRIERAMTHAARHGEVFHLWWHPHNFGADLGRNMAYLDRILTHFDTLRARYGMDSRTMAELADRISHGR